MRTAIKGLALASLLLAAGGVSAGVTVTYTDPARFSDLPFPGWERDDVLKELTEHFHKLGAGLPSGVNLNVEVIDVDLAGRVHPNFRGARDLRVMRGMADWPMIHLRYTVEQGGKVIASGDERVHDMTYLDRRSAPYFDGDALRYEKAMLDKWFKERIVARR
ncbi:MAG: DUF3016 domain-containing protein [Telluria sp.]